MATNSDLANNIIKSISALFKDDKLADFTVVVEDSVLKCHRFILGACSPFFYALFTTDMMEKIDNSARLHDIDSSAFELILKVLYTRENVLNKENVLSIWQCSHRLQIPFLIERCEKLSISVLSMENYAECFRMATVFDSTTVLKYVEVFILKNFKKLKDDNFFLELSAGKLIELIQSDALDVTSEDDVLLFIYKWVESSPNTDSGFKSQNETNNWNSGFADTLKTDAVALNVETQPETQNDVTNSNGNVAEMLILRKDIVEMQKTVQNRSVHLQSLLKASRSCLASPRCLQTLYQHRLTQSDKGARTVLFDAILYQVKGYRHEYFPPAALHRNSSKFEHVGVIAYDTGDFELLSLDRNMWNPMPTCKKIIKNKIKLALFDNNIYAVGQVDDSTSKLCVLKESSWVSIAELPGLGYFLLSHKSYYMYMFNAFNGNVLRISPNSFDKNPKNLDHPMDFTNVDFALNFKEYIIVFSIDSVVDREETAVYVMNTLDETWHRHDNLDGPAKNMASFQDGDKVYLLQNNGNLWHISTDDAQMITFQFIQKIWEVKESLRGVLLYKGTLFLFLMFPWKNLKGKLLSSLPGVYESVEPWSINRYASNFICTVMHKVDMFKK